MRLKKKRSENVAFSTRSCTHHERLYWRCIQKTWIEMKSQWFGGLQISGSEFWSMWNFLSKKKIVDAVAFESALLHTPWWVFISSHMWFEVWDKNWKKKFRETFTNDIMGYIYSKNLLVSPLDLEELDHLHQKKPTFIKGDTMKN